MTTHQETTALRPSPLSSTAAAVCALLGLIDIALIGFIWYDDPPPLVVSLGVAALGVITLLALRPARRGSRPGLAAVLTARSVSAALAVPAFFLDAPVSVMIIEGFVIVATIAVLVMVRQASQQARGRHPIPHAGVAGHTAAR
jgi:hypothetical protein